MAIVTVASGTRSPARRMEVGAILSVTPSSGATATVEYTHNSAADIRNNAATWGAWPAGAVTALTKNRANEKTYFRISATSGAVSYDVTEFPSPEENDAYVSDWGGSAAGAADAAGNIVINVPGSTKSKKLYSGVIDPTADPTGVNDTDQLLEEIAKATTYGGAAIQMRPGNWYRDNRLLALLDNVHIEGLGRGATNIFSIASADANIFTANITGLVPISNFSIKNMTMDWQRSLKAVDYSGSDFVKNCLYLVGCSNFLIENCHLKNANYHGLIGVFAGAGAKVINNWASGNGNRGIHLHGDITTAGPEKNFVLNNYLYQNGQKNSVSMIVTGSCTSGTKIISISHADALLLSAAFIAASNTGIAMVTGGGTGGSNLFSLVTAVDSTANTVTITNNLATTVASVAINIGMGLSGGLFAAFEGTVDTIISGNIIYNDGGIGIAVSNSQLAARNTVITSNVIDACWVGVDLGGSNTICNNNVISNSVYEAALIGTGFLSDSIQFKNNVIDTTGGAGVDLNAQVAGQGYHISGNTIKNCGSSGIFVHNATGIKIKDVKTDSNIISACGLNATFGGGSQVYGAATNYGITVLATAVADIEGGSSNDNDLRECVGGAVFHKNLVNFKQDRNIATDCTAATSGATREFRALICDSGSMNDNQAYKLTRTNTDLPFDVNTGCTNYIMRGNYTNRTREGSFGTLLQAIGTGVYAFDNSIPAPGTINVTTGALARFINSPINAFKNADLSIASANVTLTNDTELSFPIANNENWVARFELDIGAALSTTGIKIAVTVPTGGTFLNVNAAIIPDSTSIVATGVYMKRTTTSGAALDFSAANLPTAGNAKLIVDVFVDNGTTAGTVNIQWAQSEAASGQPLLIRRGGEMAARRVS